MKPALEFYDALLSFLTGWTSKEALLQLYIDAHRSLRVFTNGEDPCVEFDKWYRIHNSTDTQARRGHAAQITELIVQDLGLAVITEPEESDFFYRWCGRMIAPGLEYRCCYGKCTSGGPGELVVTSRGADYARADRRP